MIFQTIQDFIAWNRRGLLLHFKPESFDKIDAGYKDKDGAWIAVNLNPIFYGYNTENVRLEDVPKSATDFLNSRFKSGSSVPIRQMMTPLSTSSAASFGNMAGAIWTNT